MTQLFRTGERGLSATSPPSFCGKRAQSRWGQIRWLPPTALRSGKGLPFRPGAPLRPRERCRRARPSPPHTPRTAGTAATPDRPPAAARCPPLLASPPLRWQRPGGMPGRPRSPPARRPSNAPPRPPPPLTPLPSRPRPPHCIFMTPGAGRGGGSGSERRFPRSPV